MILYLKYIHLMILIKYYKLKVVSNATLCLLLISIYIYIYIYINHEFESSNLSENGVIFQPSIPLAGYELA